MAKRIIIGDQEFDVPNVFPKSGWLIALLLIVVKLKTF